jgi:hypothetical protein
MTVEGDLQADIRLDVGRSPVLRLFRNNRGKCWLPSGTGKIKKLPNRSVIIENAHPVEYGLTNGACDLIGARQITITPDMVGQTIAVFAAAEVKPPGVKVPDHQQHFIDFINGYGGIAGVVRSPDDARKLFGL